MHQIKVSDEVYEKLKELAEKKQVSINNIIQELLTVYLGGSAEDKPITKIVSKDIVLQYKTKCRKCGKDLEPGEVVHYVRYEYSDNTTRYYIYCMDCWLQSSALAEYYLKKKELEATVRGLKKLADQYAEKITKMRAEVDINEIVQELVRIKNKLSIIVVDPSTINQLYATINETLNKLLDIDKRLRAIQAQLVPYTIKKKYEKQAEVRWRA